MSTQNIQNIQNILKKYPDKVPIILKRGNEKDGLPEIDKKKFLVPGELMVSQFIYTIRKRIHLQPDKGLYLFFGNELMSSHTLLSDVYKTHKDGDGILYATYCAENTFG